MDQSALIKIIRDKVQYLWAPPRRAHLLVLLATLVLFIVPPWLKLAGLIIIGLVMLRRYRSGWPTDRPNPTGIDDDGKDTNSSDNSSYAGTLYRTICGSNFEFASAEEQAHLTSKLRKELKKKEYGGGGGGGRKHRPMTAAMQAEVAAQSQSADSSPPAPSPFSTSMGR